MCAKESMGRVAAEVKGLPHYASEGEVRISMSYIYIYIYIYIFFLSFVVDSG